MRVIIVGGGLAGLTFASALEKADIDFVLLEARGRFDPQVGASIGLNAGALRILDQLGAAQEIIDHTAPVRVSKVHRRDGSLIMAPSPAFQLLQARFGYGVSFLDRQLVLRALYNAIGSKDKMLLHKRVSEIVHSTSGVSVNCEDGSIYHGDVVVGCDGVNSKSSVRTEMCRIANDAEPGAFPSSEITKMTAEFLCMFGISDPIPGLQEGDVDTTVDEGVSLLVITGKNGRVFWFYHERLPRIHRYDAADFPKFTPADAEALALKNSWRHCNETVTLGDLWSRRVSCTLVALEEALFDRWSWGRIATVGDNAHKMTPNHGQAGNNAIESAAALVNQLRRVHEGGEEGRGKGKEEEEGGRAVVDHGSIVRAFESWHRKRKARIEATCKEAAAICRLQVLSSWKAKFLLFWIMPNATEFLLTLVTGTLIGAEILEFLPVPERSFEGSCAFNQSQGVGREESLLRRAARAVPLLLVAGWTAFGPSALGWREEMATMERFGRTRTWQIVVDVMLVYAIWMIESNRRASAMTLAKLPGLLAVLGIIFGPGVIGPIYFFLHYVFSPVSKFAAADMRLTNIAFTKTVLPVSLCALGAFIPMFTVGYYGRSQHASWAWLAILLPVFAFYAVPRLLLKIGLGSDTMHKDAMTDQLRDLPYIRWCIYTLSTVSAATGILISLTNGALTSGLGRWQNNLFSTRGFPTNMSSLFLGGAFWISLFFYDIKRAKMITSNWTTLLGLTATSVVFAGPAVSIALSWMWREEILAVRRESHAITRDKYAGRSIVDVEGRDRKADALKQYGHF